MRKSRLVVIALLVLTAIIVFVSCQNLSQKPSPAPAPVPTTTAPAPTATPTPAPTPTPEPTPEPTPTDSTLPLNGIVTGECETVDYGVSCTINEPLGFDRIGLAEFEGQPVIITCDDTFCTSNSGTQRDLGCVLNGEGVFCINADDDTRRALYGNLVTYISGCYADRNTGDVLCLFPLDWELQNNQPFVRGVPLVLAEKNNLLYAYAGQAASDRTTFTCVPTDVNSTARQGIVCNN